MSASAAFPNPDAQPNIEFVLPFNRDTRNFVKFMIPFDHESDEAKLSGTIYVPRNGLSTGQGYEAVVTIRKVK